MATGVTVRNINIAVKVDAKSAIAQLERVEKALSGLKNASSAVEALKKSAADIKKYMSGVNKSASAAAKSVAELKKASDGAGKASGTLNKKTKQTKTSLDGLRKTIGKLLLYRAIRQTLMTIGNAFREGLKYVKEFTNYTKNAQFSDMFSSYTEMGTSLKATLGVSFASILEALEPVALGLSTALTFLADAFNQFFGAIANGGKYMKVNTAYVEQYSKSIKEAKNQVMGFDELNKLSGSELDYSQLYVETDVSAGMVALGAAITAVLAAMAGEGISDFVKKLTGAKDVVEKLTGAVGDKNTALGNEKEALELDAKKAGALSTALIGAGGLLTAISTLVDYIKLNPISIPIDIQLTAFDGITEKFEEIKKEIALQSILIPIKVHDFAFDVAEKLKEIGIDIAAKSFSIAVKVFDFVSEAKTSLEDLGKEIAAKSFTVVVKICDFVSDLKTKLKEAGAAIKGFFANLFTKEATGAGETVAGDIIPSSGHPVLNSDANEDLKKALGVAAVAALGGAVIAGIAKSSGGGVGGGGGAFYKILGFANGGYPSAGSMFIAGEAGPEIVGSINGKTGVASGDEVTGIRTAVYSIGEAIVSAINNKDTNAVVRLDDGSIYKASQRGAKRVGNSLISFAN